MKYNVALIFGGSSVEHEVSILTALQVMRYLDQEQFNVTLVYYDKHQHFYIGESLSEWTFYQQLDYTALREVVFEYRNFLTYLKPKQWFSKRIQIDIALPLVHGTSGEDGTLQGFFETYQLPYCLSSLASCALGLDKELMKQLFRYHQIPTLDWWVFHRDDCVADLSLLETCPLPKPWILKPCHGGSSIGIMKVDEEENVQRKSLECFAFDHKVLVEHHFSEFKEFNLAVLGDRDNAIVSHVEEVFRSEDILTYQDKYGGSSQKSSNLAHHDIPAVIDDSLRQQIEEIGLKAFHALQCSGIVRIDFLYADQTLYVNEVNMIPGSLALYLFEDKLDKMEIMNTILLLGFKNFRKKMREIRRIDSPLLSQDWSNGRMKK